MSNIVISKDIWDRVEVVNQDITTLAVTAIVNAAKSSLLGGGGVDGAIHKAAGPRLLNECSKLNGCSPGEAKMTKGYDLPAEQVIHTVGPVWKDGLHHENNVLASCYRSCFNLCKEHQLKSIAFPAISTGVYGFPFDMATRIAVFQTAKWLTQEAWPQNVIFSCHGEGAEELYLRTISEVRAESV